jgi:FAD/FMN-containing dehydrogenase
VEASKELETALDGEVLTPASPGYDDARRPAIARYRDVRPHALVRCATEQDVVRGVAYARGAGMHVVPRGGGHCFAGRSSTDGGIVLDLSRLDQIAMSSDGRARIGAGARLSQVYAALHRRARTLPAGCGPTVSIGGLTLGGGLGLLGRSHGLTCDSLLGARVVLADGRAVDCDIEHEPDLFWALRGGGGGQFGVVTSLDFATIAEPRATGFELQWPESAAAEVIGAWQQWAPEAPDDVTVNLSLTAEPGRPLQIAAGGAALRDAEATAKLLDDLSATAPLRPTTQVRQAMPIAELKRAIATPDPRQLNPNAAGRSELFDSDLPATAIAALLDELTSQPVGLRRLDFTALGGAYAHIGGDATAYAHRTQRFLLDHVADDPDGWLNHSWAIAHAHGTGRVYPNFPDPQLVDPTHAYYRDNLARLTAIKNDYDPDRLFHFPQAVGVLG